ncbi:XRE family transcriptional regulator [Nocardiopsis sp. NPDC050513]|uniref:XRE family transcriptional regulator n=1 Tax=Nocardiopsis sp. NPDC050513 TaxID=3364338 RepID=UPI0037B51C84
MARHLGVDESFLWPAPTVSEHPSPGVTSHEIVATYQDRASVPRDVWLTLLREATERIDVLVFSGTFFAQSNPKVAQMLTDRAANGVRIRLCFGDPDGEAVMLRGEEEGIGDTLAAKIRASLTYYRPLVGLTGCEIRLHDTTLYNSLFRYDQHLMVNPHVWGQPASANPLFQLDRTHAHTWFDHFTAGFEAVWNTSTPWNPETEERTHHGQDRVLPRPRRAQGQHPDPREQPAGGQ